LLADESIGLNVKLSSPYHPSFDKYPALNCLADLRERPVWRYAERRKAARYVTGPSDIRQAAIAASCTSKA
jgi:hypothetical protein